MSALDVVVERDRGFPVVQLAGEIDMSTGVSLEEALTDLAAEPLVVLDLRKVAFMDSTGLRIIVSADSSARKSGQRLLVLPGPESVHRVFRMTLMDERIGFIDEAAFDGLRDER